MRRCRLAALLTSLSLLVACSADEPREPVAPERVAELEAAPEDTVQHPTPPVAPEPVTPPSPAPAGPAPSAAARPRPTAPPEPPAAAPPAPALEAPLEPEPEATPQPAAVDLDALTQRLRDSKALGFFTKIELKNQIDDLVKSARSSHATGRPPLALLRERFDLLVLKLLSLLQEQAPDLAEEVSGSREGLWSILADPVKLATV